MANAPEGIKIVGRSPEEGWVSLTTVKSFDLISEGPIDGLVTGLYTFSGHAGDIGWTDVQVSGFDIPPNTTNGQFLRSIFWNQVPVVNSENKFNFANVNVTYTNGDPSNAVNGYLTDELTISRNLNERLRFGVDFAKIYRIYNANCKAVILNVKFNALSKVQQSDGTVVNDTVNYKIYYRRLRSDNSFPNFTLAAVESVEGNVTYGYVRSTRVELPISTDSNDLGFEIKLERTTEDSIDSYTRNMSVIESMTEIYNNSYSYPYSAVVLSEYTAEAFSQIPTRAFDVKLLKVKIPSNYDPLYKTYTGDWDGTWKDDLYWTDNPAFCFYDLLTNKRYGLGNYINENIIDKWTLYEIAQYCDTLVPDGYGNVEPRFTCNLVINSREEAYKVINDFASIFRALAYYCGGTIGVSQDKEKDLSKIIAQFTNSNVEDGNFNYSSSSRRVRHTVAVVRYNDSRDFYKPAIEYVEDVEGIKRYGIREVELTAFGCTSRGQAVRFGRWALLSEIMETETVTFTAGFDAALIRPGDIFKVVDSHRYNARYAGRTLNITYPTDSYTNFKLDSTITGFVDNDIYKLTVLTPTYYYDPAKISDLSSADVADIRRGQIQNLFFSGFQASGVSGNTYISCTSPFTGVTNTLDALNYNITGNNIWSLETYSGNGLIPSSIGDYYRTIKVVEKEDYKLEVTALQYAPDKYIKIESGLAFERPEAFYANPPDFYPDSITLEQFNISSYTKAAKYTIGIDALNNDLNKLGGYYVYAKQGSDLTEDDLKTNNYLINILPSNTLTGFWAPSVSDYYYFKALSYSLQGIKSANGASNNIYITTNPIKDVEITNLKLKDSDSEGQDGTTYFTKNESPTFEWQTNINQSLVGITGINYRISFFPPDGLENNNLLTVTGYTPTTLSFPDYNFDFETNIHNCKAYGDNQPPHRKYDVKVEVLDGNLNVSPSFQRIRIVNSGINGFRLTDDEITSNYNVTTKQWLTTDGDIRVNINNFDNMPEDIAGGYLYFCEVPFDKTNLKDYITSHAFAKDGVNYSMQTQKFTALANANYIPMNPPITGSTFGNIAMTLYDSFDQKVMLHNGDIQNRLDLPDRSVFIGDVKSQDGQPPIIVDNSAFAYIDIKLPRYFQKYSYLNQTRDFYIPHSVSKGQNDIRYIANYSHNTYNWIPLSKENKDIVIVNCSNILSETSITPISTETINMISDRPAGFDGSDYNRLILNSVIVGNYLPVVIGHTVTQYPVTPNNSQLVMGDQYAILYEGPILGGRNTYLSYSPTYIMLDNSPAPIYSDTNISNMIDWKESMFDLSYTRSIDGCKIGIYSFHKNKYEPFSYTSNKNAVLTYKFTQWKAFLPINIVFDKKPKDANYTISYASLGNTPDGRYTTIRFSFKSV